MPVVNYGISLMRTVHARRENFSRQSVLWNMMETPDITEENFVVTTYGALEPGQAYRLPGNSHWYRRSKNGRLTDEMCERVVETLADDSVTAA